MPSNSSLGDEEVPSSILLIRSNGSQDGSTELCLQEEVQLISLPSNRGFPIACNLGLTIASGDALLLLNNDTIVTTCWLDNMLRCLYSSAEIGIVGPMTNYASGKQQITEAFTSIDDMVSKMNTANPAKWEEVKRLVGFCYLFKREVLERVGMMDERFSPGHFEDDDYCYRARQAGYKLMISGDVFIYHHGSVSFQKEGEEKVKGLLLHNHQKFIEKWGVDPHSFLENQ
ncbi:glycosyltransferase [Paenibacillus sp. LMG 31460]|uniref:Glycosyltransferase n=1 Tax=Paenibacillus germinis TaxID=2654979 RepID=A0ABX1ZC72_9BACL|nr:glycosyltransferase family 2 protein [Paenibacillus germinis]NOU90937.1 glycosyltransferase [Paenibacillus germinis]